MLKTDGGGEYRSREFAQYLRKHQIEHEVTVPDSPEINGLAERTNRTILEKAKCMCAHADLPKSLRAEAASTACYMYNRLPNAPLKCKSPHEVSYSRKPDLSNLRVFGCVAYALVPAAKRKKFANRTGKMRFLGYYKGHRGYKLMEKGSNRVFYRADVTFDENNFRLTAVKPAERRDEAPTVEVEVRSSGSRASLPAEVPVEQPIDVPARQREDPEAVATPREREPEPVAEDSRPIRDRKQVMRYRVEEQINVAEEVIASALCAAETEEPKNMNQARKRPDAKKWMKAAQDEMDSLLTDQTTPWTQDHW